MNSTQPQDISQNKIKLNKIGLPKIEIEYSIAFYSTIKSHINIWFVGNVTYKSSNAMN